MVIVVRNWCYDMSSNLDETDRISHSTYTFVKGMNPLILPPAMSRLGSLIFFRQPVLEKENLDSNLLNYA